MNFTRLDMHQCEEDMDVAAGWEMDMFLDTPVVDDAIPISFSGVSEDREYSVAMSELDRRYSFPSNASVIGDQEEHELSDDVQHGDQIRKDLRSASIPYKRDADQGQKYYYFKAVKLGDVGQAYYTTPDGYSGMTAIGFKVLPADRGEAKVELWTKRSLFIEAQGYPCPPRHHHHCRGCNEGRNAWTKRQASRRAIRQTLKGSSASTSEEGRLVHLDVLTESVGDECNYPRQVHGHSYAEAVEEKNHKIAGEIVDRAVREWENSRRCEASRAALSVTTAELSPSSWSCPTPSDIVEEIDLDGAWELLPLP